MDHDHAPPGGCEKDRGVGNSTAPLYLTRINPIDMGKEPNTKPVLVVYNRETKTTFTIGAQAFVDMQDDTYGTAENPKKKYEVKEGTPLPRKEKKNG